jgi:hypothetical protein
VSGAMLALATCCKAAYAGFSKTETLMCESLPLFVQWTLLMLCAVVSVGGVALLALAAYVGYLFWGTQRYNRDTGGWEPL